MLTHEKADRLRCLLGQLSDLGLLQHFVVVIEEVMSRGLLKDVPPKSPKKGEFADCEPKTNG